MKSKVGVTCPLFSTHCVKRLNTSCGSKSVWASVWNDMTDGIRSASPTVPGSSLMYREHHYGSLRRVLRKGIVLSSSAMFLLFMHGFAQSLMTTYVGPQLPANGSIAATQSIDQPTAAVPDGAGGLYIASYRQNRVYFVASDGTL